MRESKSTMADVARLAGVSPSTAARVISGRGYVSDDNRALVQTAVATLGYRPNAQARALRYSRSFSLGLILSVARLNPIFTNIGHAVRRAAATRGYFLLTVNHGYSAADEAAGIRQFLDHGVEAVFLCHAYSRANLALLERANVPLIQIERRSLQHAPLVRVDPLPGMRAALAHLAAHGHRRIAFIGGTQDSMREFGLEGEEELARADAFRQAAQEAGLAESDLSVELGPYSDPTGQLAQSGRVLAARLLDRTGPGPTAIVSGSDLLTAGVLQELYARRLRVPDDLSLVSFDDSMASQFAPACAAIAQPYTAIGQAALELVDAVGGPGPHLRDVATTFVSRNSTGPAPSS